MFVCVSPVDRRNLHLVNIVEEFFKLIVGGLNFDLRFRVF
jgi:hypothetical protein